MKPRIKLKLTGDNDCAWVLTVKGVRDGEIVWLDTSVDIRIQFLRAYRNIYINWIRGLALPK